MPECDVRILTLDESGHIKNDPTKYDFHRDDHILTYIFKNETERMEVKNGDSFVWKYTGNPFHPLPIKILLSICTKFVLLEYDNTWLYYYKGFKNNEQDRVVDLTNGSSSHINIVTHDGHIFHENNASYYDLKRLGNVLAYKFLDSAYFL